MNEDSKLSFGFANITIGEGEDAVQLEAMDGTITLTPNETDIEVSDFGKSFEFEGTLEMPAEFRESLQRMTDETFKALHKHIEELLQDIVDHFGITMENKKNARIETIVGAPPSFSDFSNVYIDDVLVARYVPNELPFRCSKFY